MIKESNELDSADKITFDDHISFPVTVRESLADRKKSFFAGRESRGNRAITYRLEIRSEIAGSPLYLEQSDPATRPHDLDVPVIGSPGDSTRDLIDRGKRS